MLIKKMFPLFILTFLLESYELDIKKLQHSFYKEVLIQNIYHKRFLKHLSQVCPLSDGQCYEKEIIKLQKKYSILEDRGLQKLYSAQIINTIPSDAYIKSVQYYLKSNLSYFTHSQFVTFIDLSKQLIFLFIFEKKKNVFHFIGKDLISAGNIAREKEVILGEDHFLKTPTGIFEIKSGWRSVGEILSDGYTLPYGQKDRFIFYFGKQPSVRYNTFDRNGTKLTDENQWTLIKDELSFALHAHQSSNSLGKPYSHGCVRITNELNTFLDNHMALHKKVIKEDVWVSKYASVPKDPKYYDLAGSYLFIVHKLPLLID